ncbi:MAG: GFA family protein [Gammaproteobacteria bacterium]|nr:GFA family protein [Gammaproteobacteria bacterium]
MTLKGSCLCNGIQYEISSALKEVRNCHCTTCRKAHSAAFRTRASINKQDFKFLKGEELLTFYQSDPGTHRGFCKVCGSTIFSRFDHDQTQLGFSLGTLDSDPGTMAEYHIFVSEKAAWFQITDGLPQYDEFPPK